MDLKETFRKYIRVLQVARKPSKDEFITMGKMSALGIFIIGFIGFIIFIAFVLWTTSMLLFTLTDFSRWFYVTAEIIQLISFILLLGGFILVFRK